MPPTSPHVSSQPTTSSLNNLTGKSCTEAPLLHLPIKPPICEPSVSMCRTRSPKIRPWSEETPVLSNELPRIEELQSWIASTAHRHVRTHVTITTASIEGGIWYTQSQERAQLVAIKWAWAPLQAQVHPAQHGHSVNGSGIESGKLPKDLTPMNGPWTKCKEMTSTRTPCPHNSLYDVCRMQTIP
jgi:hypothetical protein